MPRNRAFEDVEGRNAVPPLNESTQEPAQLSADKGSKCWAPVPVQARYRAQAEPDVGFEVDMQRYPTGNGGLLVSGQNFRESDIPDTDIHSYSRQPNQMIYVDNSTSGGIGPHLGPPTLPRGCLSWTSRHISTQDRFHEAENPQGIRGELALENLEDFIQRIEGEALVPLGQVEEPWTIPYNKLSMMDGPNQTPLGLFGATDYNSTNTAVIIPGRTWFLSDTDLLSTAVDNAALFPDEASFSYPDSLAVLESYPRDGEEGYLAVPWQPMDMF
jgi:hypothetical protein